MGPLGEKVLGIRKIEYCIKDSEEITPLQMA